MDITFNCDKCGQSITVDEAGAGQLVDCPKCGTPVEVPYKSATLTGAQRQSIKRVLASASAAPQDKKCPYCAEQIRYDAIKCKHCGEFLNRPPAVLTQIATPPTRTYNPGTAAVLGLVFPGMGQLYIGRLGEGFAVMVVTLFLYVFGFSQIADEGAQERYLHSGPYVGDDLQNTVWHWGWIVLVVGLFVQVFSLVQAYRTAILTAKLAPAARTES